MIPLVLALILTWNDNSLVEDNYLVYRRAQNERTYRQVAVLPADTTRWVDTNTRRNRTYCYFVVATKKGVDDANSEIKCERDRGTLALSWASGSRDTQLVVDK
jgi:hypothetical protein